jgi:hypothetical protein
VDESHRPIGVNATRKFGVRRPVPPEIWWFQPYNGQVPRRLRA